MQQTSKYQFNLVDATDDFSPDPLNQNMEKVEEQFESVETDLSQVHSDLGTTGRNLRFTTGTYQGNGQFGEDHPNSLSFDFIPVAVLVHNNEMYSYDIPCILMRPLDHCASHTGDYLFLSWSEHGVSWYNPEYATRQMNVDGDTYYYTALGYDG